jgi:hypothetical protein
LRLTSQSGVVSYSQEIKVKQENLSTQYWPNPVKDKIFIKLNTFSRGVLSYSIINASGAVIKKEEILVNAGEQTVTISAENFNNGIYHLKITGHPLPKDVSLRFVK